MGIRRVALAYRSVRQPVYKDGDTVEAEVTVEVAHPQRARRVLVIISGLAHCEWSANRRRYKGRIIYLNNAVVVWQPESGRDEDVLPVGVHRWAFSFQLPAGLPSSCTVPNGGVTYSMTASVDIPWGFDKEAEMPFFVTKRINIGVAQLQSPASKGDEKEICCCCCASGPVTLRATINKRGLRCGEDIEVSVVAQNQSTSQLGAVRIALLRKSTVQVQDNDTSSTEVLAVVRTQDTLAPGQDLSAQGLKLKVPRCSPSVSARVVLVEYIAEVALDVPTGFDLSLKFPIVIGTVDCSSEQAELIQLVGQMVQEAGRIAHIRQSAEEEGLIEVHEPPPAYDDTTGERNRLLNAMM